MRHRGQEEVNAAVEGAAKRTLIDSWAWSKKHSQANIAPLVAVTLAHHGLMVHGAPKPAKVAPWVSFG
jgi:hypothetical protein